MKTLKAKAYELDELSKNFTLYGSLIKTIQVKESNEIFNDAYENKNLTEFLCGTLKGYILLLKAFNNFLLEATKDETKSSIDKAISIFEGLLNEILEINLFNIEFSKLSYYEFSKHEKIKTLLDKKLELKLKDLEVNKEIYIVDFSEQYTVIKFSKELEKDKIAKYYRTTYGTLTSISVFGKSISNTSSYSSAKSLFPTMWLVNKQEILSNKPNTIKNIIKYDLIRSIRPKPHNLLEREIYKEEHSKLITLFGHTIEKESMKINSKTKGNLINTINKEILKNILSHEEFDNFFEFIFNYNVEEILHHIDLKKNHLNIESLNEQKNNECSNKQINFFLNKFNLKKILNKDSNKIKNKINNILLEVSNNLSINFDTNKSIRKDFEILAEILFDLWNDDNLIPSYINTRTKEFLIKDLIHHLTIEDFSLVAIRKQLDLFRGYILNIDSVVVDEVTRDIFISKISKQIIEKHKDCKPIFFLKNFKKISKKPSEHHVMNIKNILEEVLPDESILHLSLIEKFVENMVEVLQSVSLNLITNNKDRIINEIKPALPTKDQLLPWPTSIVNSNILDDITFPNFNKKVLINPRIKPHIASIDSSKVNKIILKNNRIGTSDIQTEL